MDVFRGFPDRSFARPVHLSIGSFDGVHLGHQALVERIVHTAQSEGALAGVLTFDPHPLRIVRPSVPLIRLTNNDERAGLLSALGLDFMVELPFTRATADTTAEDFMRSLVEHIPVRTLWVGPDFALGRGREGNALRLSELGLTMGYAVAVVPPFDLAGQPVRSSRIRSLLVEHGEAEAVSMLLGRPYQVWGEVKHGAHRGRSLGFPTANLEVPADRLIPAHGVYACWTWLESSRVGGIVRGRPSVVNIGVRPSFDAGLPSLEAHLLDFDGDLYGETLGLSFIARLRGEQRFADIGALVRQIGSDVETAGRRLANVEDAVISGAQPGWSELRHTADWAIRVIGASQRELFARTAEAMFSLMAADDSRAITLARAIQLDGEDLGGLLVAWLNALLLGQELGGEIYTRFAISEISHRGLRAVAYGYEGVPAHTAIKAATFYGLEVTRAPEGWSASVTFDV